MLGKMFTKKHSCEILLAVCCAVLYGTILSLFIKEASSGNASAAAVLTKVLIDSVFCLAFSFCLYQLLISLFREKEAVLIVPLQVQVLSNDIATSEVCTAFLKTMFPNADEKCIRYQLQEFIDNPQFMQSVYNCSFNLMENHIVSNKLQSYCVSQPYQFQTIDLD